MKTINIAVAGQAGAGKTTIAKMIQKSLENEGLKVIFVDDEPFQKATKTADYYSNLKDIEVKLVTVQTSRSQLI